MELIRGIHNLRDRHVGCVATIGNFDGVHLGHQQVLRDLKQQAKTINVPLMVIVFEPQPQEFFTHGVVPPRLTRLREKYLTLREHGVDRVLAIQFNQSFSALRAEQFIQQVLVEGLGVKSLVVGDDFRFGKDRNGDFTLLQQTGHDFGFDVASVASLGLEGERVSSTRIRESLLRGDLLTARQLLGRPYHMCGRVAHGDKLGRKLGFPTANIHLHRLVSPISGIFAVEVKGLEAKPIKGVANVGTRPTVGGTRSLLEVYLFDFEEEIYGRYVEVAFLEKYRDEEHYSSLDLLKEQIEKDVKWAREYFDN